MFGISLLLLKLQIKSAIEYRGAFIIGSITDFKSFFGSYVTMSILFHESGILFDENQFIEIKDNGLKKDITFDTNKVSKAQAVSYITRNFDIVNISLKEISIEDIVKSIF